MRVSCGSVVPGRCSPNAVRRRARRGDCRRKCRAGRWPRRCGGPTARPPPRYSLPDGDQGKTATRRLTVDGHALADWRPLPSRTSARPRPARVSSVASRRATRPSRPHPHGAQGRWGSRRRADGSRARSPAWDGGTASPWSVSSGRAARVGTCAAAPPASPTAARASQPLGAARRVRALTRGSALPGPPYPAPVCRSGPRQYLSGGSPARSGRPAAPVVLQPGVVARPPSDQGDAPAGGRGAHGGP